MSFLRDLAKAHEIIEGFYPPGTKGFPRGSLSYRQNNPGNLRYTAYHRNVFGAVKGEKNFATFPSYELGLHALMEDLRAKITGYSAHINYSHNPTFLTYVRVYAPKDDENDPEGYCQKLIKLLPQYNLRADMPLSELASLVTGVKPPVIIDKRAQTRRWERLIALAGKRSLKVLARLLARLKKRFGYSIS